MELPRATRTTGPAGTAGEVVKGKDGQVLLPVANHPIDGKSTYTVGAEVSRFQRSTVPSKGGNGGGESSNPADQWAKAMGSFAGALTGKGGAPAGQPGVPAGPVVRVARGNSITIVPVGAK